MSASGDDHALADVTNRVANVQVNNEENLKRVREAQWTEPQAYNYEKLQRDGAGPAAEDAQAQDADGWAASAAKYEWSDEYGDVGPKHEPLERMLFGDENKMEKGSEFSK